MAIAHARKLIVGDVTYQWRIDGEKDRYSLGWTPGRVTLVLRHEDGTHMKFTCRSKHWTDAHQESWTDFDAAPGAPEHKVPFGPRQVRQVIDAGCQDCELEDWKVVKA